MASFRNQQLHRLDNQLPHDIDTQLDSIGDQLDQQSYLDFLVDVCGMPSHLNYEKAKEWAKEWQAKKDADKAAWQDRISKIEKKIEERLRERLLDAGFTDEETSWIKGGSFFIRGDDPRLPAHKDAMRLYHRDWKVMYKMLGVVEEIKPTNTKPDRGETGGTKQGLRSFIVHGHEESAKLALKNYLQNTLGWPEPFILAEKRSGGKTIIEKFEEHSENIDVVFVLLTPDDLGGAVGSPLAARARQNVILELGNFTGKFGRASGRVILLYKGDLELPSDLDGIIYIDISNGVEAAGEKIRKEVATLVRIN